MSRPIVVVGSLNMDLVVRCAEVPEAGETLAGDSFFTAPGGKGANQAVAAARLGARVHMVGCVGRDDFGQVLRATLERDRVDTRHLREVETETGTAVILVEHDGENRIVVVAGANGETGVAQAGSLLESDPAPVVVMQLEIPLATVDGIAEVCETAGAQVLLNAAPVRKLSPALPGRVHHLVVNETEARELLPGHRHLQTTDPDGAVQAARDLQGLGPRSVTLTLGSRGAVHVGKRAWFVEAPRIKAVDSTGAGDALVGALAAATAADVAMPDALVGAVAAGSLAVTRAGAQPSLPHAAEVDRLAATLQARPVS